MTPPKQKDQVRPTIDVSSKSSTSGIFYYLDASRISGSGFRFNLDHDWTGAPSNAHRMMVQDVRTLPDPPRFDREGFQAASLGLDPIDPRDPEQIERLWRPAACRAVKALTGADAVASWGFGARFSERLSDAPRNDVSNPARRVHSDYSPTEFGREIVQEMALEEISKVTGGRELRRWIGVNVWQPVSQAPYDTPLALCDARSIAAEDAVIGRGSPPSSPTFSVDLVFYKFNEQHRWFYYPSMRPDEALVFCGIDSAASDRRFVPHTAFDDPACPADAAPRSSVEIRTMALFFA